MPTYLQLAYEGNYVCQTEHAKLLMTWGAIFTYQGEVYLAWPNEEVVQLDKMPRALGL